jgi:hypothetical protein
LGPFGHVVYPVFDGKDVLPAALLRLLESSRERTDRPSRRPPPGTADLV